MDTLLCCFPVLALIGIGFVGAADRHRRHLRALRRDGTRTTGWVTGHDENTHQGRTTFVPVVTYRDTFGVEHQFRMKTAADSTNPPVGTEVPVLFVPGRPESADADNALTQQAAYRTPLIIGVVLLGITAVLGIAAIIDFVSRIEVH